MNWMYIFLFLGGMVACFIILSIIATVITIWEKKMKPRDGEIIIRIHFTSGKSLTMPYEKEFWLETKDVLLRKLFDAAQIPTPSNDIGILVNWKQVTFVEQLP